MASDFLPLDRAVPDGGIDNVRFFNGRLLSGRDMAREQDARRGGDALSGAAFGSGVAHGLEVLRTNDDVASNVAVVTVRAGLAVNERGEYLDVATDQRVQLTRIDSSDFSQVGNCLFGECVIPESSSYVSGEGVYVLTLAPAVRSAGRAQVNGLQGDSPVCNIDRDVATTCFRLIEIPPSLYSGMSTNDKAFRNRLAYRCFGEGVSPEWPVALLNKSRRDDDLFDKMVQYGLQAFDVPLAIIAFTGTLTVKFLDCWSARRPLALADGPVMAGASIASCTAPRRASVGRSMLHQFQEHLAELTNHGVNPAGVKAGEQFLHLPPAGILHRLTGQQACDFFGGMTVRGPVHINAAQVEQLLRDSLAYPAILANSKDVVWLYAVAENAIEAAKRTADPQKVQPFHVFASGHVGYRADARFNLHRWNYANFALGG
jgi:hypothetical protein